MKRNTFFLTVAALVLVLSMSIGSAMAYFTTYTTAQGGKTIHLGGTTTIEEPNISDWTKHVVVSNEENGQPVYVRAIAYAGSQYALTYTGTGWSLGEDGYYYYGTILEGGASTEELLVQIGNIPDETEDFNVVVIYESTPVVYDAAGNPYADWTQTVVHDGTEGGLDE